MTPVSKDEQKQLLTDFLRRVWGRDPVAREIDHWSLRLNRISNPADFVKAIMDSIPAAPDKSNTGGQRKKDTVAGTGKAHANANVQIEPRGDGNELVAKFKIASTRISFPLVDRPDRPAFFSLGIRKSGSTLLHKVTNFLARRANINVVDLPGTFFSSGFSVSDWKDIDVREVIKGGNLYSGFRHCPPNFCNTSEFGEGRKVFMFRDPRDALVSQYFSDAFSHSLPRESRFNNGRQTFENKRKEAREKTIDEWVLERSGGFLRTMKHCLRLLADPNCLCFRYEKVLFQKKRMIEEILAHFGWQVSDSDIQRLLDMVDVIPNKEDEKQFVRKAVPGDHKEKLQPATIERINDVFREPLKAFDYDF